MLALLWPAFDTGRARAALNQAVYALRADLGDGVIETQGNEGLRIRPEALWCDVAEFGRRFESADRERALELYKGEFLPWLHVSGPPEFERWLDRTRRRLQAAARDAALRLAHGSEQGGDPEAAAARLQCAREIAPADEATLRRLLELPERTGDRARALAAYDAFARRQRAAWPRAAPSLAYPHSPHHSSAPAVAAASPSPIATPATLPSTRRRRLVRLAREGIRVSAVPARE